MSTQDTINESAIISEKTFLQGSDVEEDATLNNKKGEFFANGYSFYLVLVTSSTILSI